MWRTGLFCLSLFLGMAFLRADDFVARTYTGSHHTSLPYRLFIPPDYDAAQKYPLILFFHGAGERGVDNDSQLHHVVRNFVTPDFQSKHPCFILVPQCPSDQQWVDMPWGDLSGIRPSRPSAAMQLVLKILDDLTTEFTVDKNRIYVAGISMGGYATWDCITRYPDRFAAGIVCCGGGDENTVTASVAQVPLWAFHSADDPIVPVVRDRNMIAAMTKKSGHPKYTEYQGLGHGSWDTAYAEPQLFPWLFQQTLDRSPVGSP